jgi:hypothetical protein
MPFALIGFDGLVLEISNSVYQVVPALHWVECGENVTAYEWREDAGELVKIAAQPSNDILNAPVLTELAEFDAASIRAIREYIVTISDAPQVLIEREAAAKAARAKLVR